MFSKSVALRFVCLAVLLSITSASWGQNGLFQAPQSFDSGGNDAFSVAVGDANRDGKPDLIVANLCLSISNCGGVVSVLLGKGDGTFQSAQSYSSGGVSAESIAVGDANVDGNLDVFVANFCASSDCPGEGGIGVLIGNGDGTFQPARTYGSGGEAAFATGNWISAKDVNGDNQLDLLVANLCLVDCTTSQGKGGVSVLLGNGDGTFQAARGYDSGGWHARSIAVADVNEDGDLDLLVTNEWSDTPNASVVSALLGNGDGTFQAAQSYQSGGRDPASITVADVNEDGMPDLLVANACSGGRARCGQTGFVGVLLGNGDGTFQAAQRYESGGHEATSLVVGDVNGDGRLDLLVANLCRRNCLNQSAIGIVGALLGNGDGTFQLAQSFESGGTAARSIALADVNGDGASDLLVGNECPSSGNCDKGVVSVLLGRFGTTTDLNSSLNPSVYGQAVTFEATVSSTGPNTPTGTITFRNGTKYIGKVSLTGRVATLTTRALPVGALPITATYNGAPEFMKSTSAPISQLVTRASSTTAIASSANPSMQGQPVTFTAKVTSPTARVTGTVTFTAGTTTLGTVTLSGGKAILTTSAVPQGNNTITASFDGTANVIASAASLTQVVN